MDEERPPDAHPLSPLKRHTEARIALGRAGAGLPTQAALALALAHAAARDAVHGPFDRAEIAAALRAAGLETIEVASRAATRADYLRRPDLGRSLADEGRAALAAATDPAGFDLAFAIADGLSPAAVNANAAATLAAILAALPPGLRLAPVVLATQGRVALGDPVGEALGARLLVMLIGERPGLSAADSLGAYLTFGPRAGRSDAERNCVSNIRRGGLDPALAGPKIAGLALRALALGLTGTALKDDEDEALAAPSASPALEAL